MNGSPFPMARLFGPNLRFVAVIKPLFDCWLGPTDAQLERTHYWRQISRRHAHTKLRSKTAMVVGSELGH